MIEWRFHLKSHAERFARLIHVRFGYATTIQAQHNKVHTGRWLVRLISYGHVGVSGQPLMDAFYQGFVAGLAHENRRMRNHRGGRIKNDLRS